MGKLLSLGKQLRYPIVINKLLKRPGDSIKKQEPLFQFKYTWMKQVGDATYGDEWEEEQVTIMDFDSPVEGVVNSWKIKDGMTIEGDSEFVDIEETCPHSIQFAGLCGMCGKDMTETSWASASNDTERAKINMVHDQNFLTVSEGRALEAEGELQRRLLKHKKLTLVVDLDQTIIHACIEPTVGEWQNNPTSPNYEAVKNVRSFQLDDGPRGLASGCWYYIKMRPGLANFLSKISEMYELHVYTMGTRAYATNIAKIVDPDKKLFGDRIISRDENGSMTAKNLARLFPVDTKMVVIIDDRADVWPNNRPNLIKVHPYDFFLGIGDINSSFLPKREEIPKSSPPVTLVPETSSEVPSSVDQPAADGSASKDDKANEDGSKVSALEELVRMGGGDDQALRQEQAAEQVESLKKQIDERPLAKLQEELDKEENIEETPEEQNGGPTDRPHHRHNLLKDDDEELKWLEQHLTHVHKAFYDEYESVKASALGGRVAQLKPGRNKKISIKDDSADLRIVPDIAHVMPQLKTKVLAGCTIVMSGLVPLSADLLRTEIALQATSFGAVVETKITRKVTHLITHSDRTRTQKARQAAKYPKIKIVTHQWLLDSISRWMKQNEEPYTVEIPLRNPRHEGPASSTPSINDSDSNEDDESDIDFTNSVPASQEEEDDVDGVIPSDLDPSRSPVDDMKTFNWGGADEELKEFMGSDFDSDSDTGSEASDSSQSSRKSLRGFKRARGEGVATDDDSSDDGSVTRKKVRHSATRVTGLKTVKTPTSAASESSLPTPGHTDGDGSAEDKLNDELEADLMAAFEEEDDDMEVEEEL